MKEYDYRYIYGPVPSWRLGRSLGIDPVPCMRKICTFDCLYCQVGETEIFSDERRVFVPAEEIINELKMLPPTEVDYITFSGRAEPVLARNLGEMVRAVKQERSEKIAVLTNSSLLYRKDVQDDLMPVDFVAAKLDAPSQGLFESINRPLESIKFDTVVNAIKEFKRVYKGKLALQIMFVEANKDYAKDIARIAKEINPDEVQINTPLRPSRVKPLSKKEIYAIKDYFKGMNVVSVYEAPKVKVTPISKEDTLRRRGKV
ncbi:MAG: hypothetical protein B1H08_00735 [Candidatus Omnitrophica bacterium 4484_171]|nr:MAG: hypothetical protein B1H08_00735 [Candidatus Omnitrophica bacterium 4484_171]